MPNEGAKYDNPLEMDDKPTNVDGRSAVHVERRCSIDAFDSESEDEVETEYDTYDADSTDAGGGTNIFAALRQVSMDAKELLDGRDERRAEALKYMKSNFIISPDGGFRKKWDLLQLVALSYVAIVVPYRIGFTHDTKCNRHGCQGWFIFDVLIDLYFVIDIFLSFRTAYCNNTAELEYLPNRISRNYLRGWFTIDALGCLPINYIVLLAEDDKSEENLNVAAEQSAEARINKVFRLLRLARLLKLLRLLRFQRMIQRYEEEFYALASGFAMLKILIAVGIIGHWLACVWYYAGDTPDVSAIRADGTAIEGWVENHFGGAASDTSYFPRYLASIYWSFMTMTTVGYGDIPAATNYEKWVAVFGMLIGGFTFGLIVGSLGEMARKANPGESYRQKKIAHTSSFLAGRGVSASLMRRVRVYFSNHYTINSVFGANEVEEYFSRLPIRLRDELAREVGYLRSSKGPALLEQVHCFHHLDDLSTILICSRLKTITFDKSVSGHDSEIITREYVFREGERAWEMYIILEGRLILEDKSYNETIVEEGHCIDEHVILLPVDTVCARKSSAYAPVECILAGLSAEDLVSLRNERGEIDRHLTPYVERAIKKNASNEIRGVFATVDTDSNGKLDKSEFVEVLTLLGVTLNSEKVTSAFAYIAGDAQDITRAQFESWWLKAERAAHPDDGGTVSVLEHLQSRVREIDESSMAMEIKLGHIQKLIAQKFKI
jgi:hypothetical protein